MTTSSETAPSILYSKVEIKRTWQLNRHLANELNFQLIQIKRKSTLRDLELKQTIEKLKREIKARKFEEAEIDSAKSSYVEESFSRFTPVSYLEERRGTTCNDLWSTTSSLVCRYFVLSLGDLTAGVYFINV